MREYDWRDLALDAPGRSLVEASAGTGKTWTIGVLYLRLLLEQGLSPRQIVVATYTNAAADELRRRLRARLLQALAFAASPTAGDPGKDAGLAWLSERWGDDVAQRGRDVERLRLALAGFDQAPVSTLHGLCSRILADHPFAANTPFRAPKLADSTGLREELGNDLWRLLHSGPADDATTQALREAWARVDIKRDVLAKMLKTLLENGVVVPGGGEHADLSHLRLAGDLEVFADKAGNFALSTAVIRTRCQMLAATLRSWHAGTPEFGKLKIKELTELLSTEPVKGLRPPADSDPDIRRLLDRVRDCIPAIQLLEVAPRARFLQLAQAWARGEIAERQQAAGQLGFDDLLVRVLEALQPATDGSRPLADALFAAWPVALIDEFQDTDPVQYGILDAIHRDAEGAPRGRLVLIGDPKQAIYRFRGGDIHTYERARGDVGAADRLALAVNRRSSDHYVEALNQFFELAGPRLGAPGSTTGIAFEHALPGGRQVDTPYAGEHADAPLVLHVDHAGDKDEDEQRALRDCADRIAALLGSGASIGGEPLVPADLAVLVPWHAQARDIAGLLKARGVPCVVRARRSVFRDSDTARDLLLILHAVVHCQLPATVRAAAATGLWGLSYPALRRLFDQPLAWQATNQVFHAWRRLWTERGVMAVVDALIRETAARHLDTREGERVLTDLRHLAEQLQEFAATSTGMESVLKWMQQQIDGSDGDEEAAESMALRIESDGRCVQVMTLHSSKGLEFPIVFLPMLWAGTGREANINSLPLLADGRGERSVVLAGPGRAVVEREDQDERYRLLYVALTRAIHACHVWLRLPSDDDGSAPASAAPLACMAASLLPDAAARLEGTPRIGWVSGWKAEAAARFEPVDAEPATRHARALPSAPTGPLPGRHSFTTLTSGSKQGVHRGDESAVDEVVAEVEAAIDDGEVAAGIDAVGAPTTASPSVHATRTSHADLDALLGVAGADFGNAVHAIFELRVPGLPLVAQRELVRAQLAEFNVRARGLDADALADRVIARLQVVLDTRLADDAPSLAELPAADLRAELEFNYALDGASLARLRAACDEAGYPGLVPARNATLAGLMNGKIDLVFRHDGRFHVLDYKGNQLGDTDLAFVEDYAADALARKMDAVDYRLQALLYVVAVERYLRERLGDRYERARHLGDAWYLFVRAVGLSLPDGTPCGVWRHRFDDALLDAVQRELSVSGLSVTDAEAA